ncbi:LAMI_0C03620g1_1 [Lachancea mirantina]|uniref:Vacuolar membrane-associated protein IML1 n=1 Tax=Lachancea mirantina TaxID=1230905 RepID=A0A1G4J252_9SACH|nr:LAMI_0C03620g1_1 [Lachancea mirantina]
MPNDELKFSGLRSNQASREKLLGRFTDQLPVSPHSKKNEGFNAKPGNSMRIENNTLTIGDSLKRLQSKDSGLRHNLRAHQPRQENEKPSLQQLQTSLARGVCVAPETYNERDTESANVDHSLKKSEITEAQARSYQMELGFHEARFSDDPVLLDLSQLPHFKQGELAELKTYRGPPGSKFKKIYFVVKNYTKDMRLRYKSSNVSVLSGSLQRLLDVSARTKVWIKIKDKERTQADLVELNLKDILINRGDMWMFSSQLQDTCVYKEQKITFLNTVRTTVKGIYRNGRKILSGYVGKDTRIIFRSESARMVFLVQITDEMWHFEENGEIMFHKVVNSLFPKIFKKWKTIGAHHSITIVFSASIDLSDSPFLDIPDGERSKNTQDYFRIVVDQVNVFHWSEIMKTLRKEFMKIARELKNVENLDGTSSIRGRFSPAVKSNFLESICFASTLITNPFRQPDLRRTTSHLIIVSPGSGLYDVDFDLLKATSRRLLSIELSIDIIFLTRAPLHIVPLFRYRDYGGVLHHCTPSWLSISFWDETSEYANEWHPRCKMHHLQMMGLTETEMKEEVEIDVMTKPSGAKSIQDLMEIYDNDIFAGHSTPHAFMRGGNPSYSAPREPHMDSVNIRDSHSQRRLLAWNTLKSAAPLTEASSPLQVLGDVSSGPVAKKKHAKRERERAGESENSLGRDHEQKSLALDSLRNASRPSTVAHRLVSRIIPEFDLKNKRSVGKFAVEKEDILHQGGNENQSQTIPTGKRNTLSRETSSIKRIPFASTTSRLNLSRNSNQSQSPAKHKRASSNQRQFQKAAVVDSMFYNSWLEISNPSIPVSFEKAGLLIEPRWKDVFPKFVAKKYTKWRSFTMPAELPVTVSLFPDKSDFDANFTFSTHSVISNQEHESTKDSSFNLLRDMIYVRLLAGFQICTGEGVREVEASKSETVVEHNIAKYLTKDNFMRAKFYLMAEDEIHRLNCDFDGTVEVQRHMRKSQQSSDHTLASYAPLIKTRYEIAYRASMVDPLKMDRERCNWNQLDQVVAGYSDSISEQNQRSFRSKFVILPASIPPNTISSVINGRKETLSPEEIRLEGLRRLISFFFKSRLKPANGEMNEMNDESFMPEVLFYTGSLFSFVDEQLESLKAFGATAKNSIFISENDKLNKTIDLSQLARELQLGKSPLKLTNRKWHWKRHRNCFVGLEFITWLIDHFSDIKTREDAVIYGQQLMNDGLFVHVENRHGLLDGHYFYQLTPEYVCETDENDESQKNFRAANDGKPKDPQISVDAPNGLESSIKFGSQSQGGEGDRRSDVEGSKSIVMLSNVLPINLDAGGQSYKREVCQVHYDRVHNPDHCFHVRLEWLTATPKLIDDLINNLARMCERFGLKLVEVPWNELCSIPRINLFHSFVDITLAINPWEDPEFCDMSLPATDRFYFHTFLLEKAGFLVDNRASKFFNTGSTEYEITYSWGKPVFKYVQYVHNTGAYIAEIRENGNLFLAPNNVYLSRVNVGTITGKNHSSSKFVIDSQNVMLRFKKTCLDSEKLRAVFREAKELWLEHIGSDEVHFGGTYSESSFIK